MHAGGGEEGPWGRWRAAGLGDAGHRADVQAGAARTGLVFLGTVMAGKNPCSGITPTSTGKA